MFYNQKFIVNDVFELLFNVDSDKSIDDKFIIMRKNDKIKLLQIKHDIPDGYHEWYHIRTGIIIKPFNFKCKLNMAVFRRFKYIELIDNSYMRCEYCFEKIMSRRFKYCFADKVSTNPRVTKNYICLGCHEIFPIFIFEILKDKIIILNRTIENNDITKYILLYLMHLNLDNI